MQPIGRLLAVLSGLVLIAAGVGILTTDSARAAKTDEVKVVNAPAEPVPVSVGNTSVPVTVGNASLPVTFSNTRSTPLFVDPGDHASSAVGAECGIAFYNGEDECLLATVPAGRILTIETITCGAVVAAGSPFTGILMVMAAPQVSGAPGYLNLNHSLFLQRVANIGTADVYGITTPVRMYAAGGPSGFPVSVHATAAAGSHDVYCAISGHLAAQ